MARTLRYCNYIGCLTDTIREAFAPPRKRWLIVSIFCVLLKWVKRPDYGV